jgi:osmoprotectant transport system substrate-binding protein
MKIKMLVAALLGLGIILSACDSNNATPGTSNPPGNTGGNTNNQPPAGGSSGSGSASGRTVIVGSKGDAEAKIVGEIYAISLEVAGVPVDRRIGLGATDIAHAALLKGGAAGGIDLYPEYTSTGLQVVLKQPAIQDPQQAFDKVKQGYKDQFKLTWLDRAPLNDTQAFATTITKSQELGLKSIQDLCDKAAQITLVARSEFKDRADALPAVQKIYGGCQFKEIKAVNEAGLLYKSLVDGQVDASQADGTAGEIAGYNLVLLEDPKGYGGPYNIAPVVRDDVLAAYPKIADALNKASAKITNAEMSQLNWDVAGKGMDPHDVAKQWLYNNGLLPK